MAGPQEKDEDQVTKLKRVLFTGPQPICGFRRWDGTQTITLDKSMCLDTPRCMVSKKPYHTKMMHANLAVSEAHLHVDICEIAVVFNPYFLPNLGGRRSMPWRCAKFNGTVYS